MITFGEIKNSRVIQVTAACANSNDFKQLVNEATQRLMQRGDWVGTLVPIHTCVNNGCVVWPRRVGAVRRINYCNTPVPVRGLWYDYVNTDQYRSWYNSWGWSRSNYFRNLTSIGNSCTYRDIPLDQNCLIRAYALCQADVGKTITIFGLDNNGQPLQTKNTDGTYSDGVVITLAIPFGSTSVYVRQIDRILKDDTQKNVPVYAYAPAVDAMWDIANYEPSENNPDYVKDRLYLGCNTGNCSFKSIVALVKLAFVPVRVDSDLVLIDNIAALKNAIQAIKAEEAGDDQAAEIKWLKAVKELNLQLQNQFPDDVLPVDSGFSPVDIGSQLMV